LWKEWLCLKSQCFVKKVPANTDLFNKAGKNK